MPAAWTDDHTFEVYRNIIRIILTSRSVIYTSPGLQQVNNNGGDRINKKVQQILKKMVDGSGLVGMGGMVQEELGKIGRGKKGENAGDTPSPGRRGAKPSPTKKRKVKEEHSEEEDQKPVAYESEDE